MLIYYKRPTNDQHFFVNFQDLSMENAQTSNKVFVYSADQNTRFIWMPNILVLGVWMLQTFEY